MMIIAEIIYRKKTGKLVLVFYEPRWKFQQNLTTPDSGDTLQ